MCSARSSNFTKGLRAGFAGMTRLEAEHEITGHVYLVARVSRCKRVAAGNPHGVLDNSARLGARCRFVGASLKSFNLDDR